jgi:hypothetical protein
MKRLIPLMLAMALVFTTVGATFAQETQKKGSKKVPKKKKSEPTKKEGR